ELGDSLYDQQNLHYIELKSISSDIQNYQKSVVGTKYTDCLDRPTFVQRYDHPSLIVGASVLEKGENTASLNSFEVICRNAWADNADIVSRANSGTGALKTDFVRTGVQTKAGAAADILNSITRYFGNNFSDEP
ncbi:hypothetical protein B9Z19DRAFT_1010703, partial [Tuber borchii]